MGGEFVDRRIEADGPAETLAVLPRCRRTKYFTEHR
jgi:hypothetical protein